MDETAGAGRLPRHPVLLARQATIKALVAGQSHTDPSKAKVILKAIGSCKPSYPVHPVPILVVLPAHHF